jgi:hypothetical protein
MKEALADDNKFSTKCDEKISAATEKLSIQLDDIGKTTCSQIEQMDAQVRSLEQEKHNKNLLVRGFAPGKNAKLSCIKVLNAKLSTKLTTSDFKYALSIGKQGNDMIKLAFVSTVTRDSIYTKNSKLKGSSIFIFEDLTPRRAALYYKARQAVKH